VKKEINLSTFHCLAAWMILALLPMLLFAASPGIGMYGTVCDTEQQTAK